MIRNTSRHVLWKYRLLDLLQADEFNILDCEWACDSSESLGSLLGNLTLIDSQKMSFPVYHEQEYLGEIDAEIVALWLICTYPEMMISKTLSNIQERHEAFSRNCLLVDHLPFTPDFSSIHEFFKSNHRNLTTSTLKKKFSWTKYGDLSLNSTTYEAYQHYQKLFQLPCTALHHKLTLECSVYTYFLLIAQGYRFIPIQLGDGKIFGLNHLHCLKFLRSNAAEFFPQDILKSVEELKLISPCIATSIHASVGSSIMALVKNHVDSIAIIDENGKLGGRFTLKCLLDLTKKLIYRHWPEHEDAEIPALSDLRELIRYGYRFCFNPEKANFDSLGLLTSSLEEAGEIGVLAKSFKVTMAIHEEDDQTSVSSVASESGIGSSDDDFIDERKRRVLDKIQKAYNR